MQNAKTHRVKKCTVIALLTNTNMAPLAGREEDVKSIC